MVSFLLRGETIDIEYMHTSTNSTGSIAVTTAHYSDSTLPVTVNTVNCTGYEDGLLECPMSNLTNYVCDSFEDAGIICQGSYTLVYLGVTELYSVYVPNYSNPTFCSTFYTIR